MTEPIAPEGASSFPPRPLVAETMAKIRSAMDAEYQRGLRDGLAAVRSALRDAGAAQVLAILAILDVLLDPARGGRPVVLSALDQLADRAGEHS